MGGSPWWQQVLWALVFGLLVLGMLGRRLGRHPAAPRVTRSAAAPAGR